MFLSTYILLCVCKQHKKRKLNAFFIILTTLQKIGLQYQTNLLDLTDILWDISDLPFVQNKDFQYSVRHLDILK